MIARYIIVLDRYDDDDYLQDDNDGTGLNDGTETGGCAQVAAELQEAMGQIGQPAGFFNVVARETYSDYPEGANVGSVDPALVRPRVYEMLGRPRRQAI